MKRFFAGLIVFSIVFTGCEVAPSESVPSGAPQAQLREKVQVVTSFYPLYEIARQVGGDYVDVKNLVPAGAEPHDYELTPKDIASVYGSQILVVNGAGLEPWFEKISTDLGASSTVRIVDESKIFNNLSQDPHIWLDPSRYMEEVTAFEQTLSAVDPAHGDYYMGRARQFRDQLTSLDQQFKTGLQNCSLREFVTNHAAFGYLSRRYNVTMVPIAGLSPDAEPSPKILADLVDIIRAKNIRYILTESLVSPKIAETLAREVGAETMVLNPLEGLTEEEMSRGRNYISVMQDNLKNLQIAMNCR